jgi:hypothetical protein
MGKVMKIGIALLLGAVFFLMLVGCESPTALKLSSQAELKSVKVAGVDATLGTPDTDWEQTILPTNVGHVYLSRPKLERATVEVKASNGAIVYYAQAKTSVEPYFTSEKVFDFDADDYLFIEVFSENHDAFAVYAIQVHCRNPGLNDITFDGKSLFGGVSASGRPIAKYGDPGKPGTAWNNVEQAGEALFPDGNTGDVRISFRPEVPYLKVWVAVVDGDTEPNFSTGGVNGTADGWDLTNGGAANGDPIIDGTYKPATTGDNPTEESGGIYVALAADSFIYIKVAGSDESELTFYKLKMVGKSNNLVIANPRFLIYDGTTLVGEYPVAVGRMGTEQWAGGEYYGSYNNGAEVDGKDGTSQELNEVANPSVLSLYLDSDMDGDWSYSSVDFKGTVTINGPYGLKGQPGSDTTKDAHFGQRPPANLRVVFKADYTDGTMKVCTPTKNQRDAAEFNKDCNPTDGYDFGKLIGFWWHGLEVTSAMGEKGWYKFATRIGSQKADILDTLTINGKSVDFTGIVPAYAPAHYDPDNNFKYATVTLPANTDFNGLQIVAKPQTGYYPLISAAMAPDYVTNVSNTLFNINQDANFNPATGEYRGGAALEPGNFIFVRVIAEVSYYYGGSGFTAATWAPNRNITEPATRYGVQRFYKVQVLREGQDTTDVTALTYAGASAADSALLAAAKITTTKTAATLTSGDNSGNVNVSATVTNTWSAQTAGTNDIKLANLNNPSFAATLASGSDRARVGFALRTAAIEDSNAPVDPSAFLAPARFNAETVIDSNTWLVMRIVSENGKNTDYYRFHLLNTLGNVTAPTAIKVGTVDVSPIPAGNAAVTGTTAGSVKLANKAAFDSVTISVTKPDAATSVAIGLTNVNNAAPDTYVDATGTGTAASVTFQYVPIAQYAVIRVISADKTATMFYKVRLELNNANTATTITDIKVANTSIGTLPTANAAPTGTNAVTYFISGAATVLNNLQVNVTAATGSTVTYAMAAAANTNVTDFTNTTGLFPIFQDSQYVVIKVTAEDNIAVSYYKVQIINGTPVTITFNSDGGSSVSDIRVKDGGTMGTLFPAAPTRSGFEFDGWYLTTDTGFTGTKYIATTVINGNTALKAKWVAPPDNNIRTVSSTGATSDAGTNATYGLYIGGMPAVSNGTPGRNANPTANGKIVSVVGTNTANSTPVVVIVENAAVTKVEFGTSADDATAPTNWADLTKTNDSAITDKRYTGTIPATAARAWVKITSAQGYAMYRYEWYTASSARATLSSLKIDDVDVDSDKYGSFAGWWNTTTAPNFTTAGEATISAAGSVEIISAFNNSGSTGITSYYVIPAATTVPLLEGATIPAASFTSTAGTGGTGNVTVADGDHILIRYASDQASGNYWGLVGYYLIKVTVSP